MMTAIRVLLVFSTLVAAYFYQHIYHVPTRHSRPSSTSWLSSWSSWSWSDDARVGNGAGHGQEPALSRSTLRQRRLLPRDTPAVYAIADLHGDYPRTQSALYRAGVVDQSGAWAAGNATLVQTGDIVDRGPDTGRLYAWMRNLTEQATRAGGSVVKLWGNHEYMNAMGDLRYVDDGDVKSFEPEPHERARRIAFADGGWIAREWEVDYGVVYRDARYRAHFMHAGLSPATATLNVGTIGREFMKTLTGGRWKWQEWSDEERAFWSPDGPMWYRGHAELPEVQACKEAETVMRILDVDFLVMGHTPNFEGVVTRCGGRVLLIDTGLSSAYGGRPVVLEMRRSNGTNAGRDGKVGTPEGTVEVGLWYDDAPTIQMIEVH